jgi:hypothetical protein
MDDTRVLDDHNDAWQMVLSQLQPEMNRADYNTWVNPIIPLGFNGNNDRFRLAVQNEYNRDLINSRLNKRISRLLSGLYKRSIEVEVVVANSFLQQGNEKYEMGMRDVKESKALLSEKGTRQVNYTPADEEEELLPGNKRKIILQRAYGTERAQIIQPDKGIYVTKYFLENWLPLLGHSAFMVVMMVRKVCYWNPYTGEKRDVLDTEMGELAAQACISVRTLKTVLKNELIRRYFIRYSVRRVMTPNGIRTAGIRLQVRMDDPLTPQDQEATGHIENGTWFLPEFEDESEDYDL